MNERRWPCLIVDRPLDRVVRITLDRPPVNALGAELVRALGEAAHEVGSAPDVSCVLLAARGKAFCAGADLKERATMSEDEALAAVEGIRRMVGGIGAIAAPTVAVIQGAALGGGLELALACDLRIAAEEAPVGLPECSLAIIPGAGGTQRLSRLAGPGVAKKWVLTARTASAAEAHRDGFVEVVVPAGQLEQAALDLARQIARCGPLALAAGKKAIDSGLTARNIDLALIEEWQCYQSILRTEDRREALRAFAERRPPRFQGR